MCTGRPMTTPPICRPLVIAKIAATSGVNFLRRTVCNGEADIRIPSDSATPTVFVPTSSPIS